jgi:GH24 family phage-related lysozyme (muramidase)
MGEAAGKSAVATNDSLSMSPEAKARMRKREVDVFNYYDDGGAGRGHCTWGPCTKEELAKPVSQAAVEAEFARRVAKAEREVRSGVRSQALSQAQFDALVSLAYNAGARGSRGTWKLVEKGDMKGAGANIKTMIKTTINGKLVVARGLVSRREEEAAPFLNTETASAKK